MTDLEEIMKAGLRDLAGEAPAGDGLWVETEEKIAEQKRRRIGYLGGRALAIAAVLIAAIATISAVQDAPAKRQLTVTQPGGSVPKANSGSTPTSVVIAAPPSSPKPTDPLPTGTVLLAVDGRRIVALDAEGRGLKTLVTVFEGRAIDQVQLLSDHHTIWYSTEAAPATTATAPTCPDVVQLDLATNARSVVGHSRGFSVTPDGTRVELLNPQSAADVANNCSTSNTADFSVRDVKTGATSTLASPSGLDASSGPSAIFISPTGDRLVGNVCTAAGCRVFVGSVPKTLGGALAEPTLGSAITCDCRPFSAGPDGVYFADTKTNAVRRFDWSNLAGAGVPVTGAPAEAHLVRTTAGYYSFEANDTARQSQTYPLYRVDANGNTRLGTTKWALVVEVAAFSG